MRRILPLLFLASTSTLFAAGPEVISVKPIGGNAKHNAFTDLTRWKGAWYCAWRESEAHVGGNGGIRIVTSKDGERWTDAGFVTEKGIDLRDPKLSETPDGRLMLLMGGSVYEGRKLLGRRPRVSFSADGRSFTAPKKILGEGDWLWRLTWRDGVGYGASYRPTREPNAEWALDLYRTKDGLSYEKIKRLDVDGRPGETTLRFLKDGAMVALVRRETPPYHGKIGTSPPPYSDWSWTELEHRLGGPNFLVLDDGALWATGREYHPTGAKTHVAAMTTKSYRPMLTLPSGGDTSYAGMIMHEGLLWMSYYSGHEGKTKVYLAKIKLD